jgi:adenylate cyclase
MYTFQKLPDLEKVEKVLAFIDIASYTEMVENDEETGIERAREFLSICGDSIVPKFNGSVIQRMGDGLLISFDNAQQSALCAMDIHELSKNAAIQSDQRANLSCRIGIHSAIVMTDQAAVYGHGVNMASRIAAQALPGETIVSAVIKDQLQIGVTADVSDLGDVFMKNVDEPVRLYKVFDPRSTPRPPDKPFNLTANRPSIAVLPFNTRSNSLNSDPLGELVCDGLVHELCRASNFRIISRLSSNVLTGSTRSAEAAKSHLSASYLVNGSYLKLQGGLVLSIELSSTSDGQVLWTDRIQCGELELLQAKSTVLAEIAAALIFAIGDEVMIRASYEALPNLASCDLLFGAIALTARTSLVDFDKPKKMLEHLVERHNRNALPRVWLAHWYVMKRVQGQLADPAEAGQGLLQAQRALDLEPECAHAFATLGFAQTHLTKNFSEARKNYVKALEIDRSSPWAWLYLGALESFEGNGRAAVDACSEAIACSPLDPTRNLFYTIAASAAFTDMKYEKAIEWAQKARRYDRYHASTIRTLAMSFALSGNLTSAREMKDELLRIEPNLSIKTYLARTPSANFDVGRRCAEGLRIAGIPEA